MGEEAATAAVTKTRKKKAPYRRLIVSESDDRATYTIVADLGDVSTVKALAAKRRTEKKDGSRLTLIYVVA